MFKNKAHLFTLILAAGAIFAGCGDDDPMMEGPTTSVLLRAVHASPGAPDVDIYANDGTEPLVEDVAYGDVTAYLDIPEGTYNIQIRAAGADPSEAPVYETGDLSLSDGDIITAVATGFLTSTDEADSFRILPLFEDFEAAADGTARVRIVHASPDAPTVGIDVNDDGSAEVAALERFADTGVAGVELPSGTALQIGILVDDARLTAFTTPELPDGGELFVIAIGSVSDLPREETGFALLAAEANPGGAIGIIPQNPTVYALHAGSDAPAVDIFVGETEIVSNISFSELSDPVQVPPGVYTLDFFVAADGSDRPDGDPAASFDTPSLAGGERYLGVATGFLASEGEDAFTLVAFADDLATGDSENATITAIHASPDAPPVDIGTVDMGMIDTVVFENIAYPTSKPAGGETVPAAALTLGVAATGSTEPVATFDVTTSGGLRAFAVAIGALTPEGEQEAFRLTLVNTSVGPYAPWEAATVLPNAE